MRLTSAYQILLAELAEEKELDSTTLPVKPEMMWAEDIRKRYWEFSTLDMDKECWTQGLRTGSIIVFK